MITKQTVSAIQQLAVAVKDELREFNFQYHGDHRAHAYNFSQLCDWHTKWVETGRPAWHALRTAIVALPLSEQLDLEALMWRGRGDRSSWKVLRAHADTFADDQKARLNYIAEKPLDRYLANALKRWPTL
jgi:hypothetical protein